MSGVCSAHRGPCPYDCHINGERKHLRDALRPFADASAAHGVKQGKDDLWVSLGVAGSAWVRAREALKEGTE